MAFADLIRGRKEKQKEGEEEEEEDEEQTNYSFAAIYTGPRPSFVPKAQTLTSKDAIRTDNPLSRNIADTLNGNIHISLSRKGSVPDPFIGIKASQSIIGNQSYSTEENYQAESVNSELCDTVRGLHQEYEVAKYPSKMLSMRPNMDENPNYSTKEIHPVGFINLKDSSGTSYGPSQTSGSISKDKSHSVEEPHQANFVNLETVSLASCETSQSVVGNQSNASKEIPDQVDFVNSVGTSSERPMPISWTSISHSDGSPEQTYSRSYTASSSEASQVHRREEEEKMEEFHSGEMASHLAMPVTDAFPYVHTETKGDKPSSSIQGDTINTWLDTHPNGQPSSSNPAITENASSMERKYQLIINPNQPNHLRRKGECYECLTANWMQEKETCLVCGAKICINCLLKVMGSMPEGRKCIRCVGQPINESRRSKLGKPSRLLDRLLSSLEVYQIMKSERECIANQIRPEQIYVNAKKLSPKEFAELLGCRNPPSKLKPGRYWYDNQCGYWGKEGEKPDHIIQTGLNIGGYLSDKASAGSTKVYINGREITKVELKLLKFARVQCPPGTRLWVDANGKYQEEGQNNSPGYIWEKGTVRFLYPLFSLPTPNFNMLGSGKANFDVPIFLEQKKTYKILLLGFPDSGTSAIFKQVKFLYDSKFTPLEMNNLKLVIQKEIFKYITVLLEARERFEDEEEMKGGSGENDNSDQKNVYSIDARLKAKADFFLDIMAKGEFDTFFPAATREYAPRVEEIWKDPAIQATYQRSESHMLPNVAKHFLNKVVEISSHDYQPSEEDIIFAEGISDGLGFVEAEFSLNENENRSWSMSLPTEDHEDQLCLETRYHLIRINVNGMVDGWCKWLDMFEDIHAVIFCVGLDAYDQMSTTNEMSSPQNKMMLIRELFENILKYPCFQGKPTVLFLNKYDVFEEKAHRIPITSCEWFSDFNPVQFSKRNPGHIAEQTYPYIAQKFKKLFGMATGQKIFTFKVNAREKSTVNEAFQYVKEVISWEKIRRDGSLSMVQDSMYTTELSSYPTPFDGH